MSALEHAPCGYIAFRDDQRICDINGEAVRMLERPRAAVLGLPFSELLAPRTRIFFSTHVYPALILRGELREAYVSFLKPGGQELAALLNAVCRMPDERMLLECVFLPMKRRRIFEQELIEGRRAALASARAEQSALEQLRSAQSQLAVQDQLASLGMLAAGVAHEINNPLSYVAANLELLEEQLRERADASDMQSLLAEARQGVLRIGDIVRSLRTLSRVEEQAQQLSVDLRNVVDVAARMAGNQIRHRARFEVENFSEPLHVRGDAGRLGQVLLNLLINAAQALPDNRTENEVVLRALREDDSAILEVHDNGPGIAPEVLPRIFDPFFTTKPVGVGTGLGLSVCRSIIASLGGTLNVHSAPGMGALFRVCLPLVAATAEQPQTEHADAPPARPSAAAERRVRVLIIDDDEHVTRVMARALREYDVCVLNDSGRALDLLAREPFDVILCDLMMPNVTGIDIHRAIGRTNPELAKRFIFLTGGTFNADADAFLSATQNPHIQKPFSTSHLHAACAGMAQKNGA